MRSPRRPLGFARYHCRTTDADGIGLGLTFVARLVETYDWDCEITESESGGARFEFTGVELAE